MLAGPAAAARAASPTGAPPYLLRASYAGRIGQTFRIRGTAVRLAAVDDLAGAAADRTLAGHPEAFALTFHGPPDAFPGKIQTFAHPALGSYSLLVTATGPVADGVQRYEVVVDRSVGAPKRPPKPPAQPAPAPDVPDPADPLAGRPGSPEAAAAELEAFTAEIEREAIHVQRRAAARVARRRRTIRRRRTKAKRRTVKRRRPARKRPVTRKRTVARGRRRTTTIARRTSRPRVVGRFR